MIPKHCDIFKSNFKYSQINLQFAAWENQLKIIPRTSAQNFHSQSTTCPESETARG